MKLEDQSFEYTDDEEGTARRRRWRDSARAYYNAKSERDAGELDETRETFESLSQTHASRGQLAACQWNARPSFQSH